MAVNIEGVFDEDLSKKIQGCNLLVVGAGGIGCELLKNLVLTGFEKLHVIDLDTIELSNLNRQFLFHKQHIGRSKALVARESVLKFNPQAVIIAEHESITNAKYDVNFFKQFTVVANALDNIAARSHVNRMCLAADVPLIESGTAGYKGQVTVYKKKETECFECVPRKRQKTYPGCTIRNTPSEPVHCIVWAKNVFNQLFGETDADSEVSPDLTDPSLEDGDEKKQVEETGNVTRVSTREWAKSVNYDPEELFQKLFVTDINYLISMASLWKTRTQPVPLKYGRLSAEEYSSYKKQRHVKDQQPWSLEHCCSVFSNSAISLRERIEKPGSDNLVWDKDDDVAMDFVAACANLRSFAFHIPILSKFEMKSIAGNIIPAIATTNAVISGLLVMQIIKVLQGDFSKCKTSWLNATASGGLKMISSGQLEKPNPKCIVCCANIPELYVQVNVNALTIRTLNDKILKELLHMIQPDVMVNNNTATILISSDPDDYEDALMNKTLADFKLTDNASVQCDDFSQHYKINLIFKHGNDLIDQEFKIVGDVDDIMAEAKALTEAVSKETDDEDADDISFVEVDEIEMNARTAVKTKATEVMEEEPPTKKIKSTAE